MNPYTHTDWEGTGVYPDILASTCIAFDKTKQTILTDLVQHGTTEEEKTQAQWQLDDLTASQSQQQLMPADLAAYRGSHQGPPSLLCRPWRPIL